MLMVNIPQYLSGFPEIMSNPKILSACPGLINFVCILIFYVSIGMLLKGIVKSSPFFKNEPLTPNIDKIMGVLTF